MRGLGRGLAGRRERGRSCGTAGKRAQRWRVPAEKKFAARAKGSGAIARRRRAYLVLLWNDGCRQSAARLEVGHGTKHHPLFAGASLALRAPARREASSIARSSSARPFSPWGHWAIAQQEWLGNSLGCRVQMRPMTTAPAGMITLEREERRERRRRPLRRQPGGQRTAASTLSLIPRPCPCPAAGSRRVMVASCGVGWLRLGLGERLRATNGARCTQVDGTAAFPSASTKRVPVQSLPPVATASAPLALFQRVVGTAHQEAGSNLSSPVGREQTKGSPGMDDTTTALPDLWNTHASITRDASNAKSTQTPVPERVWRGARGVECGDPTLLALPAALASLSCSRPCLPHAASPFLPHILPDGSLPFFFAFSASAGLRGKHSTARDCAKPAARRRFGQTVIASG